jgi:hypothetical protein
MKHYCLARSMANNLKLSEDEEAPTVVSTESEQPFQVHGLGVQGTSLPLPSSKQSCYAQDCCARGCTPFCARRGGSFLRWQEPAAAHRDYGQEP